MLETILGVFTKIIGPGVILGLVVGFGVAFGLDRAAAGWPNWTFHIGPFAQTIHFPPSLAAAGDAKAAAAWNAFDTEQGSFRTLQGAFGVENASIGSLKTSGDRMVARTRAAVQAAAVANAWRLRLATKIQSEKAPPNADELALCRAADAVLLEGAQ
jgi:hypothetical protein